MNDDGSQIHPVATDWFSPTIEYQGQGCAEFSEFGGEIQGPVTVRFDGGGRATAEMAIEDMKTDVEMTFGLMQFVQGARTETGGGNTQMSIEALGNACLKLTVTTDHGVFSAEGDIPYDVEGDLLGGIEGTPIGGQFVFKPLRAQFQAASSRPAKYWVLPLSNFVTSFDLRTSVAPETEDLAGHPLRLMRVPPPAAFSEGGESAGAIFRARAQRRVIPFEYEGQLGFIEMFTDCGKRIQRLKSREARSTLTAVLVGEIGADTVGMEGLGEWIPISFLRLLGLATGTEVGSPWIELRDESGGLIERLHVSLGRPDFDQGHVVIDQAVHGGIGRLLTVAGASPDLRSDDLLIAIQQIIRGGPQNPSLDDRVSRLSRGLDSMCQELGTYESSDGLSAEARQRVKEEVGSAVSAIRALGRELRKADRRSEAEALREIAGKVKGAPKARRGFGRAVVFLIERFGLADAEVVTAHLEAHPRDDGRSWHELIPWLRGQAVHRFLNVRSGVLDINEVWRITNHLQDLATRIVLKRLGYDGHYQPLVSGFTTRETVDWVKPDTPAPRLGYLS